MFNNIIPIDFVAGSHGHFLEVTLNKFFGFSTNFDSFTNTGTSHVVSKEYIKSRRFQAGHWFEECPEQIQNIPTLISIKFKQDDLLLVSSVSLLRAGDFNISNDHLEIDTYNKLNNPFYKDMLDRILKSYPFLKVNKTNSSIPRNILREFFKFGFANPDINGYWLKQQQMRYSTNTNVFYFDFDSFYDLDKFTTKIKELEIFLDKKFDFSNEFFESHSKFLNFIAYSTHKADCDKIIQAVVDCVDISIPKLSLFQESYINGQLENIYKKEMPFHNLNYFTSTKDMLQYIMTDAPNL